nr:hypothetical protein [Saccharopolyspora sp. HNM0983]
MRVRPAGRLVVLLGGLALYGTSMALMVRAELGLGPWDVLHEGAAQRLGISFGTVTALTGAVVLLAWIPLRQRPGVGTVANIAVIAVTADIGLRLVPPATGLPGQITLMLTGIVLNGLATATYVGTRLGPGPRDGLMTGLHLRTGASVRMARTIVELCVLAAGWVLGGTVGACTVLYAGAIGPLTQLFLRFTAMGQKRTGSPRDIPDTTE